VCCNAGTQARQLRWTYLGFGTIFPKSDKISIVFLKSDKVYCRIYGVCAPSYTCFLRKTRKKTRFFEFGQITMSDVGKIRWETLYRLCGSLHGPDTFWARGLSWINKETTTTSDLTNDGITGKKTLNYRGISGNQRKKHVGTLVRLLWRAAAPGLKPLRLPRARDCMGSSNNLVQMRSKFSAKNVKKKNFFECLYLVPGLGPFGPRVNCLCVPAPPPFNQQSFLDFPEIISRFPW